MQGEQAAQVDADVRAGLIDSLQGICVDYDWPGRLVKVNIGGAVQVMPWVGPAPWRGDTVRVIYAGQKPFCKAVYGSALGTVQSITANVATVLGDDGRTYRYPFRSGDTLSNGFRVAMDHALHMVVHRISAEPPASAYDTPAGPAGPTVGAAVFRPIDSGNFSNGSFTTQFAEVSSSRTAAYWYGTQIRDTIPAGSTVTVARLSLSELWDQLPGVASRLGTHTQPSRGGEPAISGAINVTGGGDIDILAYAAALKSGTAFGVGFAKNFGWRRFDTFALSGSIYMEWSL